MTRPDPAPQVVDAACAAAGAYVALWDAYASPIYRYCYRRTGDRALAEDLTSIVFLEAWRRREAEISDESRLPWLYGIATNVLRNQRRSQRRYEAALARLPRPVPEPDFADALEERLSAEQEMRAIVDQLAALSIREREALTLCAWEGLTPKQAAVALGLRETTVRVRLHRARARLSRSLADTGVVPPTGHDVAQGDAQ